VIESLTNVVTVIVLRNHRVTMVLGIQSDVDDLNPKKKTSYYKKFVPMFSKDQVAYRRNKEGEILQEDSHDLPKLPV